MLTLLGRATPEISALKLFDDTEIAVLLDYAGDMGFKLPCQKNPDEPPEIDEVSLGNALEPSPAKRNAACRHARPRRTRPKQLR